MGEWIIQIWYTHTIEHHSALKKVDICYIMVEPGRHKPGTKGQILHDSTSMSLPEESGS